LEIVLQYTGIRERHIWWECFGRWCWWECLREGLLDM